MEELKQLAAGVLAFLSVAVSIVIGWYFIYYIII